MQDCRSQRTSKSSVRPEMAAWTRPYNDDINRHLRERVWREISQSPTPQQRTAGYRWLPRERKLVSFRDKPLIVYSTTTCLAAMFSSSENGISDLSWSKYLFYFSGCEVAHIKRETDYFLWGHEYRAHLLNIRWHFVVFSPSCCKFGMPADQWRQRWLQLLPWPLPGAAHLHHCEFYGAVYGQEHP